MTAPLTLEQFRTTAHEVDLDEAAGMFLEAMDDLKPSAFIRYEDHLLIVRLEGDNPAYFTTTGVEQYKGTREEMEARLYFDFYATECAMWNTIPQMAKLLEDYCAWRGLPTLDAAQLLADAYAREDRNDIVEWLRWYLREWGKFENVEVASPDEQAGDDATATSHDGVLTIEMRWKQAARLALVALEAGTEEGKRLAKAEIMRMADVADFAVDLQAEARKSEGVFTVWVQQANGEGTTHISSHAAADADEAATLAMGETCRNWGIDFEPDALRILGIAKGEVEIVEWEDLNE